MTFLQLQQAALRMANALRKHLPTSAALERANNIVAMLACGDVDGVDAVYEALNNPLCPPVANMKSAMVDACIAWEEACMAAGEPVFEETG